MNVMKYCDNNLYRESLTDEEDNKIYYNWNY